jgi:hypothetical protein
MHQNHKKILKIDYNFLFKYSQILRYNMRHYVFCW